METGVKLHPALCRQREVLQNKAYRRDSLESQTLCLTLLKLTTIF